MNESKHHSQHHYDTLLEFFYSVNNTSQIQATHCWLQIYIPLTEDWGNDRIIFIVKLVHLLFSSCFPTGCTYSGGIKISILSLELTRRFNNVKPKKHRKETRRRQKDENDNNDSYSDNGGKNEWKKELTWSKELSWTNDVVEERVCRLRRQRLDEVEQFTQQEDELVLSVTMSQLLEEDSEEQRRFLDETVPDHLLRHRAHFTHTHIITVVIIFIRRVLKNV